MSKVKLLFSSRKFWAALIGLCLIILKVWRSDFPIESDQLTSVVYVLVAYILGTGIEDGFSSRLSQDEGSSEKANGC